MGWAVQVAACSLLCLLGRGQSWTGGPARIRSSMSMQHVSATQQSSRRAALQELATTIGVGAALVPRAAYADDPVPTAKVYLDIAIGDQGAGRVVVGLYGKEAPEAAANFLSVAKGDFRGDINYDKSTVTRVDSDRRIDLGKLSGGRDKYEVRRIDSTGRVRRQIRQAAEDLMSTDKNALRHDRPGRVSVVRGGGTFEFTIAPAANSALDETNTVFGQVLSGMDVISAICAVPVTKEDILGSKQAFAGAGKGFDPRARIASINKPLSKIEIVKAGVLP